MSRLLEIATSDFTTTRSAVEGGADRIELCANLAEGGTTPSYGLIMQCREAFATILYAMIRPRGGDFLYTDEEFEIMMHDLKLCKQLGCDGVVFGLLMANGMIDVDRTCRLVEMAYPMGVTFHRAFDRCKEPIAALEQLVGAGCERILTSGQRPTAEEGIELIAELNRLADHRIIIMPGSGIRKENIKSIAERTGCTEFHSSLRSKSPSAMQYVNPGFQNEMNNSIDPKDVQEMRSMIKL